MNEEGINVLSLFDGMSCGQIALNKAGVKIANYFASEIEARAMKITQHHYPNTIQLGSVINLTGDDLPHIDLLIGGSPCQDLSMAKTDGQGLEGDSSRLFWEYVRLFKKLKPKYFLLENVKMKKEWEEIITQELGVEPIEINSNLVSPQNRKRLYWTNIPNVTQPEDKGLTLGDIIFDDTYRIFQDERIEKTKVMTKNYLKWDISGKGHWSQQDRAYLKDNRIGTLPKARAVTKLNLVVNNELGIYRKLHPVEVERCQTVPDHYTDVEGVSVNQRLEIIGNGWTVDVIAHIFQNLN